MRHLLFLVGAMFCVNVAAQEENTMSQSVKTDSVSLEELSKDIALLKELLLDDQ